MIEIESEQTSRRSAQHSKIDPIIPPSLDNIDANANKEAHDLDLDAQKELGSLLYKAIRWIGNLVLTCIMIVLLVRVIHLIIPVGWDWLTPNQLNTIDHIILGAISGFAARVWPKTPV